MADQAQQATKGATGGAEGAVNTATSGILSKIEGWGSWVAGKGMGIVDSIFPPEKRSAFLAKIQAFMLKNPKLSVSAHAGSMEVRREVRPLLTSFCRPSSA